MELEKFKYTQKQIEEITGLKRNAMYLLRTLQKKKYKDKIYTYKPALIEGIDYIYYRRELRYSDSAISKINNK